MRVDTKNVQILATEQKKTPNHIQVGGFSHKIKLGAGKFTERDACPREKQFGGLGEHSVLGVGSVACRTERLEVEQITGRVALGAFNLSTSFDEVEGDPARITGERGQVGWAGVLTGGVHGFTLPLAQLQAVRGSDSRGLRIVCSICGRP